jgi:hypothetical protein
MLLNGAVYRSGVSGFYLNFNGRILGKFVRKSYIVISVLLVAKDVGNFKLICGTLLLILSLSILL